MIERFGRDEKIYGKSYEQWVQEWYRWACMPPPKGLGVAEHPLEGSDGEEKSGRGLPKHGDGGEVWFCGTAFDNPDANVVRKVSLPANTAILAACINLSVDKYEYEHVFLSQATDEQKKKAVSTILKDPRTRAVLTFRENESGVDWIFHENLDYIETTIDNLVTEHGYYVMATSRGDHEAYSNKNKEELVASVGADTRLESAGYYCFLKPENFKEHSTYTITIYDEAPFFGRPKEAGQKFSSRAVYQISR